MKKQGSILKRAWVLLLMVTYLFIAVTYILFLPKYNRLRNVNSYAHMNAHSALNPGHHTKPSYGTILVLVHQVYRSTIETKRIELNNDLSQGALITALFVTAGLILSALLMKSENCLNSHKYADRYAYLSYCILRI